MAAGWECPSLPMLGLPSKDTARASFLALKPMISAYYEENPDTFHDEIRQLDMLRESCGKPSKDYNGVNLLRRYYSQLHLMRARFHPGPIPIDFAWKDAFTGADYVQEGLPIEQASVLYNIAALHSQLGSYGRRDGEQEMKEACTHFQCAAGALSYLNEHLMMNHSKDISPEFIALYKNITLGQAQECLVEKSLKGIGRVKNLTIARLAARVTEYYTMVSKALETDPCNVVAKKNKDWNKLLKMKIHYFQAIAYLYQAQSCEELEKHGDTVAYEQAAQRTLQAVGKVPKSLGEVVREAVANLGQHVGEKLQSSKKQNDQVYHEAVPDSSNFLPVSGADIVKPMEYIPADPKIIGSDILSRLIPMRAHEGASIFSEEKSRLLRSITSSVQSKDDELKQYMKSLNIEEMNLLLKPPEIPAEVRRQHELASSKSQSVKKMRTDLNELMSLSGKVGDILTTVAVARQREKEETRAFESKFGSVLSVSDDALPSLWKDLEVLRKYHDDASKSNKELKATFDQHYHNLMLLSGPLAALEASLPKLTLLDAPPEESDSERWQTLMTKVQEMKTQRLTLLARLHEGMDKDDVTRVLIGHIGSDMDVVIEEHMRPHRDCVELIRQNLSAQDKILAAVTEANAKQAKTRQASQDIHKRQEDTFKSLINSGGNLNFLMEKISEGLEFYTRLSGSVAKLQGKVEAICGKRRMERTNVEKENAPAELPLRPPKKPELRGASLPASQVDQQSQNQLDQPPSQPLNQPPSQPLNQPLNQLNQPPNQFNLPPNQFDQHPNQFNEPPNHLNQFSEPLNQLNQPPNQFSEPLNQPPNQLYRPNVPPNQFDQNRQPSQPQAPSSQQHPHPQVAPTCTPSPISLPQDGPPQAPSSVPQEHTTMFEQIMELKRTHQQQSEKLSVLHDNQFQTKPTVSTDDGSMGLGAGEAGAFLSLRPVPSSSESVTHPELRSLQPSLQSLPVAGDLSSHHHPAIGGGGGLQASGEALPTHETTMSSDDHARALERPAKPFHLLSGPAVPTSHTQPPHVLPHVQPPEGLISDVWPPDGLNVQPPGESLLLTLPPTGPPPHFQPPETLVPNVRPPGESLPSLQPRILSHVQPPGGPPPPPGEIQPPASGVPEIVPSDAHGQHSAPSTSTTSPHPSPSPSMQMQGDDEEKTATSGHMTLSGAGGLGSPLHLTSAPGGLRSTATLTTDSMSSLVFATGSTSASLSPEPGNDDRMPPDDDSHQPQGTPLPKEGAAEKSLEAPPMPSLPGNAPQGTEGLSSPTGVAPTTTSVCQTPGNVPPSSAVVPTTSQAPNEGTPHSSDGTGPSTGDAQGVPSSSVGPSTSIFQGVPPSSTVGLASTRTVSEASSVTEGPEDLPPSSSAASQDQNESTVHTSVAEHEVPSSLGSMPNTSSDNRGSSKHSLDSINAFSVIQSAQFRRPKSEHTPVERGNNRTVTDSSTAEGEVGLGQELVNSKQSTGGLHVSVGSTSSSSSFMHHMLPPDIPVPNPTTTVRSISELSSAAGASAQLEMLLVKQQETIQHQSRDLDDYKEQVKELKAQNEHYQQDLFRTQRQLMQMSVQQEQQERDKQANSGNQAILMQLLQQQQTLFNQQQGRLERLSQMGEMQRKDISESEIVHRQAIIQEEARRQATENELQQTKQELQRFQGQVQGLQLQLHQYGTQVQERDKQLIAFREQHKQIIQNLEQRHQTKVSQLVAKIQELQGLKPREQQQHQLTSLLSPGQLPPPLQPQQLQPQQLQPQQLQPQPVVPAAMRPPVQTEGPPPRQPPVPPPPGVVNVPRGLVPSPQGHLPVPPSQQWKVPQAASSQVFDRQQQPLQMQHQQPFMQQGEMGGGGAQMLGSTGGQVYQPRSGPPSIQQTAQPSPSQQVQPQQQQQQAQPPTAFQMMPTSQQVPMVQVPHMTRMMDGRSPQAQQQMRMGPSGGMGLPMQPPSSSSPSLSSSQHPQHHIPQNLSPLPPGSGGPGPGPQQQQQQQIPHGVMPHAQQNPSGVGGFGLSGTPPTQQQQQGPYQMGASAGVIRQPPLR